MGFLTKLLSGNEREIAKMRKEVDKINSFEPEYQKLSDAQLRAKTEEFRGRLAKGETLDGLLPEAFAAVREAGKRTVGMRHFDVQMIGGIVLHQGRIAEMRTGEGKTLVATLPLYLNALEGKGAHLITVNDYLSKFHANWMGAVYNFLGMSVGALQGSSVETGEMESSYIYDPDYINEDDENYSHLRRVEKNEAYNADITYGTNHVFGFDYLRDNMAMTKDDLAQRELHYAIVDEVDSILIDEARTPLIISGVAAKSTELYNKMDRVVARLEHEKDYTIDEKSKTAMLTDEGMEKVESGIGAENLSDDPELMHHASAALKAHTVYKKDIDYVVKDGQVIIVDEFTGRLMFGRRYGDGLHQAIEAKERVKVEHESQTLATITYQNYFRLYNKLCGMTGTAKTEEEEFRKIYALDVVLVPTNKPMIRQDHADVIYKNEEAKLRGAVLEIVQLHARYQPVLVGTRSIEMSERVSERLSPVGLQLLAACFVFRGLLDEKKDIDGETKKAYVKVLNTKFAELSLGKLSPIARALGASMDLLAKENVERFGVILDMKSPDQQARLRECLADGIPHNILNAKYHEREAEIIAQAGRVGAVTIATNMAGRGVDILLGGSADNEDRAEQAKTVIETGGLFILGSERHESRRIDNQLRGRAGRQGDPGASRFHVSLEDELWRVFGDKSQSPLLASWEEDVPMPSKILSKMIERTQMKMESHYFEMRKHVLQYDDVMNVQREVIYGQRRKVLEGADLKQTLIEYMHKMVTDAVNSYCTPSLPPSEWDYDTVYEYLSEVVPVSIYATVDTLKEKKANELEDFLLQVVDQSYADREKELTPELMRDIEREIALRVINDKWMEHLDAMDYLREGIGLRGYAQIDPLVAYKKEGFEMFDRMLESLQDEMVRWIFRVQVTKEPERPRNQYRNVQMSGGEYVSPAESGPDAFDPNQGGSRIPAPFHGSSKVGRNDPCPCGSGKKYKKCCGREA